MRNASHFCKFIFIWLNAGSKLYEADMAVYLLAKSRLTSHAALERCFHAFCNIMSSHVPDCKEKCYLSGDIYEHDYWWVSQGKTMPLCLLHILDKEDTMYTDEAYNFLEFTNEEKYNIYVGWY